MIWKIDVLHTLEANTKLLIGLCCNVFCLAVLSAFQLLRLVAIFTGGQEGCFGGLPNFDSRWEVCCMQRPNPLFFWEVLRSGQLSEQLGAILTCRLASASLLAVFWLLWRPWTCFYKCWSQDLPHTCPKPTLLNAVSTWQKLQCMKKTCPSIGSITSDVIEIALRSRGQQQSFSCSLLRECSECKEVPSQVTFFLCV